ncbi:MAG: MarR family transcriptional regulator [Spirochaetales bacterium]|nr:MarR family transcriptional regulator [Spirochaetales bacterium]HPO03581.1 MarR family transcriptional regulator [Treponemataceae bacterium]
MNKQTIRRFRKSMRSLERETGMLLAGETACCSVTVAQCHLMLEMEERGPSSLQDLADALALDKSTLSRTADSLVREGWAERTEDETNRRKISLVLTGTGRGKCDYIHALCDGQYRALFARIPADKHEAVLESVALIAAAMAEERTEGGAGKAKGADSCCAG